MRVFLIEDEQPAVKRLSKLLGELRPSLQVLGAADTVTGAVDWLRRNSPPDLIFQDIQLADGLSFDIFTQVDLQVPVVFTTAYDQFTLQAFKVNSVDYLLKPIDPRELEQALIKYERYFSNPAFSPTQWNQLLRQLQPTAPNYKERFLVKIGQQLLSVPVTEIAYFYSENSLVFARLHDGKRHLLDYSLDQLEPLLSPRDYFRISRKAIVGLPSISRIDPYFNGRLIVVLNPSADFKATVSRERVSDFKLWLDR